jgi:hypothetical protein
MHPRNPRKRSLVLARESIRVLASRDLKELVHGGIGREEVSRALCTTATTNGDTDCPSEATGCESLCLPSCLNHSCYLVP